MYVNYSRPLSTFFQGLWLFFATKCVQNIDCNSTFPFCFMILFRAHIVIYQKALLLRSHRMILYEGFVRSLKLIKLNQHSSRLTLYLCFLCSPFWKQSIHKTQVGSVPQSLKWQTNLNVTIWILQHTIFNQLKWNALPLQTFMKIISITCKNTLVLPFWTPVRIFEMDGPILLIL